MTSQTSTAEGEKVGQIRKRVQDLSWKQRKEGVRDDEIVEGNEEGGNEAEDIPDAKKEVSKAESLPKKSQPTFSSFSSSTSGFASNAKKPATDFLSDKQNGDEKPQAKSPLASTPARTQPTFSSFSSKSSPFNSASSSVAGPSWLAGKGSSVGGIKPSALGAVGQSHDDSQNSQEVHSPDSILGNSSAANATSPKTSASGKSLGFGAFAANKSFAETSRSSTPASTTSDKDTVEGEGNSKSFDEALRKANSDETSASPKVAPMLEKGQADRE